MTAATGQVTVVTIKGEKRTRVQIQNTKYSVSDDAISLHSTNNKIYSMALQLKRMPQSMDSLSLIHI